jgi:hypothetical protein
MAIYSGFTQKMVIFHSKRLPEGITNNMGNSGFTQKMVIFQFVM